MATFILYDGRAKCGESDEASVMDVAESEAEAISAGNGTWRNYDAIWYEQKDVEGVLHEVGPRWDLPPARHLEPGRKKRHRRRNKNQPQAAPHNRGEESAT